MQQKHKVRKHIFFTIYFISDKMWLHYYRCISKILIDTSDCMLKSVFDDHVYTTALIVITIVIQEAGVPGENHRPWASNW
jgi:hypothetical protein